MAKEWSEIEAEYTAEKKNTRLLKSCPFCGGKAKLEDMGYPHHVFCTECFARVTGKGYGEDGEADAIEKWNHRIDDSRCG